MTAVSLKYDWQDPSWVVGNSTVYEEDVVIYLTDGRFARADGVTQVQNLTWFGASTSGTQPSHLISGGALTVINTDDLVVAACQFYIENFGTFSVSQTTYPNITLSAAGLVRYVAIYGLSDGTLSKVEGTEGSQAVMPSGPADSILINASLVTDGVVGSSPDLSGYLLRADKATAATIAAGLNDTEYITSKQLEDSGVLYSYSIAFGISAAITLSPADSTDYYFGIPYAAPITPLSSVMFSRQLSVPKSGTITNVAFTIWVNSVIGSSENSSITLNVYDAAAGLVTSTVIHSAVKWNDANRANNYLVSGLSIAITQGQFILFKLSTPAWATNPTVAWLQGNIFVK